MKKQSNNINKVEYNQWWESFNSINAESPATIFRNNLFVNKIKELGSKEILDAGCGSGELIISILNKVDGINISGFDLSNDVIEKNKKRIKKARFFTQDLSKKINNIKNKYDLVICSEVIEHLKDWRIAIDNLSLVVNQGGYVIVTTQTGKPHRHHLELGHLRHFKIDELKKELNKNGLQSMESFYCGWPVMDLQYLLTDILYKNLEKNVFMAKEQSLFTKIIFYIFNFLYKFSSKNKGPQIFILARKS